MPTEKMGNAYGKNGQCLRKKMGNAYGKKWAMPTEKIGNAYGKNGQCLLKKKSKSKIRTFQFMQKEKKNASQLKDMERSISYSFRIRLTPIHLMTATMKFPEWVSKLERQFITFFMRDVADDDMKKMCFSFGLEAKPV